MTTGVARPTLAALPSLAGAGGGGGRSTPGERRSWRPGQRARSRWQWFGRLRQARRRRHRQTNPARASQSRQSAGRPVRRGGLSSSTLCRATECSTSMHLSNGADYKPPVKFLPPNANANGLIVIDNVAYVVTDGGLWAAPRMASGRSISLPNRSRRGKRMCRFSRPCVRRGRDALCDDGGGGESPNSLVALDPKL